MKKNQKESAIDAITKTKAFFNSKIFVLILSFVVSKTNFAQWTSSGTLNTTSLITGGNVGIGISTPTQKLHIEQGNILVRQGGTNPTPTLNGSIYLGGITHQGQVGLRLTSFNQGSSTIMGLFGNSLIDVKTNESKSGLIFRVDSIAGVTERMRINANGNVGIGFSSPTEKLHIEEGNILVRQGGTSPSATLNGSVYLGGVTHQGQVGLRLTSYNQGSSSIMGLYGNSLIDVKTNESKSGLIFRVDSINGFTERMRINADGNVAIGFHAPTQKLHIEKGNLLIGNNSGSSSGELLIRAQNNSYKGIRIYSVDGTVANSNFNSYFQVSTRILNTGLIFGVDTSFGNTERMRINANGNVGIGTSNPTQKIHLQDGNLLIGTLQSPGISGSLFVGGNPTTENGLSIMSLSGTVPSSAFGSYLSVKTSALNTGLIFRVDNTSGQTERMRINADGKINIGTLKPTGNFADYLLSVNGKIVAKEVQVQLGSWADYVFDDDYKLKDLSEVESYIKMNKHLPDVPSESEIKEKGINLADMHKIQMQKIEELMLYSIQQQKMITAQNELIEKQMIEIETMKKKQTAMENQLIQIR